MAAYLRSTREGIELSVLVQPRASRSRVVGEHDGRLKIQISSPPVEGGANAELVELLAGLLGLPKRAVSVAAGGTSRRKTVLVEGITGGAALRALEATP